MYSALNSNFQYAMVLQFLNKNQCHSHGTFLLPLLATSLSINNLFNMIYCAMASCMLSRTRAKCIIHNFTTNLHLNNFSVIFILNVCVILEERCGRKMWVHIKTHACHDTRMIAGIDWFLFVQKWWLYKVKAQEFCHYSHNIYKIVLVLAVMHFPQW